MSNDGSDEGFGHKDAHASSAENTFVCGLTSIQTLVLRRLCPRKLPLHYPQASRSLVHSAPKPFDEHL